MPKALLWTGPSARIDKTNNRSMRFLFANCWTFFAGSRHISKISFAGSHFYEAFSGCVTSRVYVVIRLSAAENASGAG
jgi:hypothetical protein